MGYLGFTFPGGNNGNVSSQTIQYGTTPHGANPVYQGINFTESYAYDQANRLASVKETSSANWLQYFGYDAMGNRWLYSGAQFDPSTPVTGDIDPFDANNHLNSAGYADGRGNQTGDNGYGFQYDEENRLVSSSMPGSTLATNTYDADGHRVMKVAGSETTVYVYNPQGELAAEYTTGATTTPCATTCYLMTDHLGSTRMQTDTSGNQIQLFDYAPFGETLGNSGGRDGRWAGYQQSGIHFTGKEQEGFEGAYMHYFGARYFSGGLGRFSSPDPAEASASLFDPQRWNAYSYAVNNPLKFVDRDGENPLLATALIGVGVGAIGGALFDVTNQLIQNGWDFSAVNGREVAGAALGGAISGGIAGLTLGLIPAPAVLTTGYLATTAVVNGGANVVGGAVQRAVDPNALGSAVTDFAAGAVGGAVGTKVGYVRYPLPNVKKELAAIANSSRRSMRPQRVATFNQYANRQMIRNTTASSVAGTATTNFFVDLWLHLFSQPQPQITSRICYEETGCANGSQAVHQ